MQVEKTAAPTAGRQHSASATDAVVVLDHVSKRFGGGVAVDDLSLDGMRGAVFSILEPSGCGKTPTLRIIGGVDAPGEGMVRRHGRDGPDLPAHRRDRDT